MFDVPVIEGVPVSVAVSVWLPPLPNVAEKVPAPFTSVVLAGRTALPSLLVKCTVPAYPVAVLLNGSRAVTVTLNAAPTVAVGGAETVNCVALAALTVTLFEAPVMEAVTVSVAVMVRVPAVFGR